MFFFRRHEDSFERIPLDVKGQLYVSPMPYGPYDPGNRLLKVYTKYRIEFAIMLITDDELKKKAKKDVLSLYQKAGITPIRFPISDLTSPDLNRFSKVVDQVEGYLRAGARMAVHCNAGVGRTGIMTCCIAQSLMNLNGDDAIEYVHRFMKTDMTSEQRRLVCRFRPLMSRIP